jgi:SAM-dependent MidA family methyltransferase
MLVEAGPGRGTLMADALRAIGQAAPDCRRALRLCLVETSPRLRARQAERLPAATWFDSVDQLPDGALLLVANEFFDALPIRQFIRRANGWAERFVARGDFVDVPCPPPARPGDVVEESEAARTIVADLSRRIRRHGGAALIFDYGPAEAATGDSLQALRDRRPVDPLAEPGRADLTAHVDFPGLAAVARAAGAHVHGPLAQGVFLVRLGLFQRADRLARGQPPARAMAILDAARRLAEPARMGQLFKALCIAAPGLPVPPGFEPV